MKKRLIPSELHYMDRECSLEEKIDYLLGILRFDREHPSILKILSKRSKKLPPEKLEKEARKILKDILEDKIPEHLPKGYIEWVKELPKTINFSSESITYKSPKWRIHQTQQGQRHHKRSRNIPNRL